LLALIWGSSFILIKKGLSVYTPIQVVGIRITLAAFVLLPFAIPQLNKIRRKDLLPLFVVGWVGTAIPAFLFALAQTRVDSGLSGVLNTLVPLYTFVIGVLFFGTVFKANKLIGVLVGLVGAVFLLIFGANLSGSSMSYALLIPLGGLGYAMSVNTVKRYCQGIPSLLISTVALLMALPVALIPLVQADFSQKLFHTEGGLEAFLYLAVLATISTALANVIFFKLTLRTSALFASSVTYIIPIVALMWGWIDGEIIGIQHIAGLLLILFGVYLASK